MMGQEKREGIETDLDPGVIGVLIGTPAGVGFP